MNSTPPDIDDRTPEERASDDAFAAAFGKAMAAKFVRALRRRVKRKALSTETTP